jgi:hypothetical protein
MLAEFGRNDGYTLMICPIAWQLYGAMTICLKFGDTVFSDKPDLPRHAGHRKKMTQDTLEASCRPRKASAQGTVNV